MILSFKTLLYTFFLMTVCGLYLGCSSQKNTITQTTPLLDGDYYEEELLDTLYVTADNTDDFKQTKEPFRNTATQNVDILHTSLDLRFDFEQQHVIGSAKIILKPYFYNLDTISLHAIGFDLHQVQLGDNPNTLYIYDGALLHIISDKTLHRKDTVLIHIDYTAKPNELPIKGSDAITSDKGLFFINPMGNEPEKPTQIWTQGETENNSKWFPTFDKPNERFTQDIRLTVPQYFKTLSNGIRTSSTDNLDGTRTDVWVQDQPHAPYLTMIAVGDYAHISEKWQNIDVDYYVEPSYAPYAKEIFNHTPEMLSFFSNRLDYAYPWKKYAQIVVRDFVSGAMENTTAVTFGEFVQKTKRELIDDDNDAIVAHEMMHHWFGDLVTCEDWSNLTLNEGFANYAEYLWFEHKYGKDRADIHRMNELNGYLNQIYTTGGHPLIHYHYNDKESMFDAHSYNKGGMVLHMLRHTIGDDAFFAALNKYLVDNAYTSVEVDELRMAFEDVTGRDLMPFFNQWFHGVGHPFLDISYMYSEINKSLTIRIDQSKTPKSFSAPFTFDVTMTIYCGETEYNIPLHVQDSITELTFQDIQSFPDAIIFDKNGSLLAQISENKTPEQYKNQFIHARNIADKINALAFIDSIDQSIIMHGFNHPSPEIRSAIIEMIPESTIDLYFTQIQNATLTDPHSSVRLAAYNRLSNCENFDIIPLTQIILKSELAYPLLREALNTAIMYDYTSMVDDFEKYMNDDSDALKSSAASLVYVSKDYSKMPYLWSTAKTISLNYIFDYYSALMSILTESPTEMWHDHIMQLSEISLDPNQNIYRKFMSTASLYTFYQLGMSGQANVSKDIMDKIIETIQNIIDTEQNSFLKENYKNFVLE